MDGKSPAVVARLAKQAASMYGELAPLFASPVSAKDEGAAAAHREGAMAAAVAARDEGKEGRAPLFAPPVRGRRRIGRARRKPPRGQEVGLGSTNYRPGRHLSADTRHNQLSKRRHQQTLSIHKTNAKKVLAAHFEKSWVAHTQMKGSLLDVLALVDAAKALNADTKIAKEVATLSVRVQDLGAICDLGVIWVGVGQGSGSLRRATGRRRATHRTAARTRCSHNSTPTRTTTGAPNTSTPLITGGLHAPAGDQEARARRLPGARRLAQAAGGDDGGGAAQGAARQRRGLPRARESFGLGEGG